MRIPYFHQKTDYSCGPAAVSMVLNFFGEHVSQDKLMKNLKTKKRDGTSHEAIIREARKRGFYCYTHNYSSLDEIKHFLNRNLPVIVHYLEPNDLEGHYAVVTSVGKRNIILNDPWDGEGYKVRLKKFENLWGKIPRNHRWIAVFSRKKFSIGKQYSPKV